MSDLPLPEPVKPQALDIQHDTDPEQDHSPSRRIPHLGHTILFFALAVFCLALGVAMVCTIAHIHTNADARLHPGILLVGQAAGFILTLLCAWWLFPRLWERSFSRGIEWNLLAARRYWFWIVVAAVLLSLAAQGMEHFLPVPTQDPLESTCRTTLGCWLTMAYGVLLGPLIEEIAFRGFLLPAIATAYDWLLLERSHAGFRRWESSTTHSLPALVFASLLSSAAFVSCHGPQLGFLWGVMGVLFVVSLVFCFVRLWAHSVACSVLLHAVYNFTVFAALFIASDGFRHLDKVL